MLKVVTMTAYRRPEYTQEVLASLAKCEGVSDWLFLPNVEPGHDAVIAAVKSWGASPFKPIVNARRLGLNQNTHSALSRAYQMRADLVVHVEDDTVLSPDALSYFSWTASLLRADTRSADGHQILLASGYNKPTEKPGEEADALAATRPVWTPWGWSVDRSRLKWLLDNWSFKNKKCFTCHVKAKFKQTRREIYPRLSRIQNIGYEQGENNRTPAWYRENHRTPWVADATTARNYRLGP